MKEEEFPPALLDSLFGITHMSPLLFLVQPFSCIIEFTRVHREAFKQTLMEKQSYCKVIVN